MSAAPRDRAQGGNLSADAKVDEGGEIHRPQGLEDPAQRHCDNPAGYDARDEELRRSRQRSKGGQDGGILDSASRLQSRVNEVGYVYQTQAPVTRCFALPRSRRLNIRTMSIPSYPLDSLLLRLRVPSHCADKSRDMGPGWESSKSMEGTPWISMVSPFASEPPTGLPT
jgi:hypothetical protein